MKVVRMIIVATTIAADSANFVGFSFCEDFVFILRILFSFCHFPFYDYKGGEYSYCCDEYHC